MTIDENLLAECLEERCAGQGNPTVARVCAAERVAIAERDDGHASG